MNAESDRETRGLQPGRRRIALEAAMAAHVQAPTAARNGGGDAGAAVEALQWAETAADRGDFDFAVKWLDRAEGLLGGLTARYQQRKRAWQAASNGRSNH
jgi:hypothetical protein